MNIGVDVREIQKGVTTGIGRSLLNFINFFEKNDQKNKLVLFSEDILPFNFNKNIEEVVIRKSLKPFWDQWKIVLALKNFKINLFYSPYYKIPLMTKTAVVSQILDLMFLSFPPYRKNLRIHRKLYYAFLGRYFAYRAINIITDSWHARSDIIKIWKINPKKIAVIPLGLASRYKPVKDLRLLKRVKNALKLPEKYILYLGNFKPHKNVSSLIKAFREIEKIFSEHKLVLAGPLDNDGKKIKNFVFMEGLENKVVFTDTIKETDCPEALFSLADVFVFPSLYEGFGLPPLEAMACGTPVVASNLTSVPEVVGEAGLLVNPLDIEEMSKKISELLQNCEKRLFYSKQGLKRAEIFREKDTAGRLYQHIISLLEEI